MDIIQEIESYHADEKKRNEKTLYSSLIMVDTIDKNLHEWQSSVLINVTELQNKMIQKYEHNPVMKDALNGRISIEDSLNELASINKGIKKFLPHKKNDVHNERIKDIGGLITEPHNLKTYGIFTPDNIITGGLYVTALSFATATSYFFANVMLPNVYINPTPEFLEQQHIFAVQIPIILSTIMAPIIGFGLNSHRFNQNLPINEAKYLDEKIKLYK